MDYPNTVFSSKLKFNGIENYALNSKCDAIILWDDKYIFDNISIADQSATNWQNYLNNRAYIPAGGAAKTLPVHVLTPVPPHPHELHEAVKFHQALVPSGGQISFWTLYDDRLIDLADSLSDDDLAQYHYIRDEARAALEFGKIDSDPNLALVRKLIAEKNLQRPLLLPYCTLDWHHRVFAKELAANKVVLLAASDAYADKVAVAELMRTDSILFEHAPVIWSPPATKSAIGFAHLTQLAGHLVEHCMKLEKIRKSGYIKLGSTGSLGAMNVDPRRNSMVYQGDYESRQAALCAQMAQHRQCDLKPFVEDFTSPVRDEFGPLECVVSGFFDGKSYDLWSIVRAVVNDDGRYVGCVGHRDLRRIGISIAQESQLIGLMARMARLMRDNGYHAGYVSKDVMLDRKTGRFVIHDHNDRRGGRSVVEQLLRRSGNDYVISLARSAANDNIQQMLSYKPDICTTLVSGTGNLLRHEAAGADFIHISPDRQFILDLMKEYSATDMC